MRRRLWPCVVAALTGLGAALLVSPATPAYADLPSGACALPATSASLSEGIQNQSRFVPTTGTVTATMIFVDFPDAPANDTTASLRDRLVPSGPSWYTTSSYGRLSLSVNAVTGRFYRMPRNSVDYNYQRGLTAAQHRLYITDALRAVGNSISFTGTKLLYIVPTRAASAISFSPTYMSSVTASDGAVIGKSVTFGQDIWRTGWGGKVLNHETGHTMGLPDLYAYSGDAHRFVGGWDLMGWIPGPSPDLFGWHKWKLNWLAAGQVACVSTAGQTQQTLAPLETPGGLKLVVVKVSSTRAWAAEVRTTAQVNSASCSTGVLIYSIDTTVASGTGPVRVVDSRPASGGCGGNELNDAAYGVGTRFLDTATSTSIRVLSRTGDSFTIGIDYAVG